MKKLFTTSILASAILLMGLLSGCMSENCIIDNPNPGNQTDMRAVTIHIIDDAEDAYNTRGTSPHIPDNMPVSFQTGRLFLVSQAGLIRRTHDIVPSGADVTNIGTDRIVTDAQGRINRADLNRRSPAANGTGVTIPTVPGDVRRVVIVGNYANINNLPGVGAHIDEVFARELDIISQWDALNVNLIGDRLLTNAGRQITFPAINGNEYQVWHAIYPNPVHLNPTVARFEVRGIRGGGDIQSFEVAGIFMDGFWSEARVGGDIITATPIINGGADPTHFLGNAGIFSTDFGRGVHDWFDPVISGSIGTSLTVRPAQIPQGANNPGNHHTVWSYQVFAEGYYTPGVGGATPPNAPAATTLAPRIVVRLNNVVLADNTSLGTQFITVGRFNDVTSVAPGTTPPELTHIRPSRIYRLDYIEFDARRLSPYPNDNLIDVDITVSVDDWGQGVVRPTIPFRQPNPVGTVSCAVSHTFNMTTAMGGSWEFEYRWERRIVGESAWNPVPGGIHPTLTTTVTAVGAYYRRVAIDVGRTPNVEIESAAVLVSQPLRMTNFPDCVLVGYIDDMPVRFATRNLDFRTHCATTFPGLTPAQRGFALHPGDVGQLFQFNRPYGWPAYACPTTDLPIPTTPAGAVGGAPTRRWNRSGVMQTATWTTTGVDLDANVWLMSNDPCPEGWRLPTHAELQLLVVTSSEIGTNNQRGEWLDSEAAAALKFGCQPGRLVNNVSGHTPLFVPAAGFRGRGDILGANASVGELRNVNVAGYFWSRERYPAPTNPTHAFFGEANVGATTTTRAAAQGLSVRCVRQYIPQLSDRMFMCEGLPHAYDLPAIPGTVAGDNFHLGGPVGGLTMNASGIVGRNHYQWQRSANNGTTWGLVLGGLFAQPNNYNIHLFLNEGHTVNVLNPHDFTHIRRVVIWDGRRFYSNAAEIVVPVRDYAALAAFPYTVQIGGRIWATRNLDLSRPNGFAELPISQGMLFQWNRSNRGWSVYDDPRRAWDWTLDGGPGIGFSSTTGNWAPGIINTTWNADITTPNSIIWSAHIGIPNYTDPCTRLTYGGHNWRLPTSAELHSLFRGTDRATWDWDWIDHTIHDQTNFGCQPGGRFRCLSNLNTNDPTQFLFLPAVGERQATTGNLTGCIRTQGNFGSYWSSTGHNSTGSDPQGIAIRFSRHPADLNPSMSVGGQPHRFGRNIRCIVDQPIPGIMPYSAPNPGAAITLNVQSGQGSWINLGPATGTGTFTYLWQRSTTLVGQPIGGWEPAMASGTDTGQNLMVGIGTWQRVHNRYVRRVAIWNGHTEIVPTTRIAVTINLI